MSRRGLLLAGWLAGLLTAEPVWAAVAALMRRWPRGRSWELVATWGGRVPGLSGTVVPESLGRHVVRGRLRAELTAWRWSRTSRRECPTGPTAVPPFRWRVRPLTTREARR